MIDLVGNTQIKRGITYSRFDTAPDAPISSFELNCPRASTRRSLPTCRRGTSRPHHGGDGAKRVTRHTHGRTVHMLRPVRELIPVPLLMPTTITGQNGAVLTQNTRIGVTGCPAAHKRARKAKSRTGARSRRRGGKQRSSRP